MTASANDDHTLEDLDATLESLHQQAEAQLALSQQLRAAIGQSTARTSIERDMRAAERHTHTPPSTTQGETTWRYLTKQLRHRDRLV